MWKNQRLFYKFVCVDHWSPSWKYPLKKAKQSSHKLYELIALISFVLIESKITDHCISLSQQNSVTNVLHFTFILYQSILSFWCDHLYINKFVVTFIYFFVLFFNHFESSIVEWLVINSLAHLFNKASSLSLVDDWKNKNIDSN